MLFILGPVCPDRLIGQSRRESGFIVIIASASHAQFLSTIRVYAHLSMSRLFYFCQLASKKHAIFWNLAIKIPPKPLTFGHPNALTDFKSRRHEKQ
jgi:hypothetical protein